MLDRTNLKMDKSEKGKLEDDKPEKDKSGKEQIQN